eukprot:729890-Prymnesium_polylepis.1
MRTSGACGHNYRRAARSSFATAKSRPTRTPTTGGDVRWAVGRLRRVEERPTNSKITPPPARGHAVVRHAAASEQPVRIVCTAPRERGVATGGPPCK